MKIRQLDVEKTRSQHKPIYDSAIMPSTSTKIIYYYSAVHTVADAIQSNVLQKQPQSQIVKQNHQNKENRQLLSQQQNQSKAQQQQLRHWPNATNKQQHTTQHYFLRYPELKLM